MKKELQNVADNSGARELMCIRIIGTSNRQYAQIGDVIVVTVLKEAGPKGSLERSEVVIRAVMVIVRPCFPNANPYSWPFFWRLLQIVGVIVGVCVCVRYVVSRFFCAD